MSSSKRPLIVSAALLVLVPVLLFLYITWDAKHIKRWDIVVMPRDNAEPIMIAGVTHKGFLAGVQEPYYFRDLVFIGDKSRLDVIMLQRGGNKILVSADQLDSFDATGIYIPPGMIPDSLPKKMYSLRHRLPQNNSALPVFRSFFNWGGDGALAQKIFLHPLFLFTLICVLIFYYSRRLATVNRQPAAANRSPATRIHHLAAGVLFVALFFILITGDKYYFLQDDNYSQFTPVIVNGLDGWYQEGSFPTYNALQLAGTPTSGYSTYAFLYPGTHISYLFSKFVLNDVYQFNNVFAFIHFALGFFFCYRLLLRLKLHPALAIVAALSFVFCGFNLMAVRSWYYVAPTVCFLPAVFYVLIKKPADAPLRKSWVWPTVLFTLYAFSGNFQYWVYTFIFFALFELLKQKKYGSIRKGLLFLGLVFVVSLAFFSPQLYTTFNETKDLPRSGGEGQGILSGSGPMLFPYITQGALPNGWGRSDLKAYDAFFYYGGFVFLLLALAALLFWLLRGKCRLLPGYEHFVPKAFLLLLALAFVYALGRSAGLWWLTAKLPLFNKFNHPFKFLLYVQFFGIVAGAVLFQQLLYRWKANTRVLYAGLAVITGLLFVNTIFSRQAFYKYKYDQPYAVIPWLEKLDKEKNYRIMPVGPLRSPDRGFEASLHMNFPMVYGIPSLDGYEPLNHYGADVYRYHREYGVRYFIESKHTAEPGFPSRKEELRLFRYHDALKKIYEDAQVNVYEDTLYDPVVQLYNTRGAEIKNFRIKYRNNGLDVQLLQPDTLSRMRLSLISRKGLNIYYNNRLCRKFLSDQSGRIYCTEVLPASVIRVRYKALEF